MFARNTNLTHLNLWERQFEKSTIVSIASRSLVHLQIDGECDM